MMGLLSLEVWGLSAGGRALEKVSAGMESCPVQYGSHHTHVPMEMKLVLGGKCIFIFCKF